jgi:hypothetical protein
MKIIDLIKITNTNVSDNCCAYMIHNFNDKHQHCISCELLPKINPLVFQEEGVLFCTQEDFQVCPMNREREKTNRMVS